MFCTMSWFRFLLVELLSVQCVCKANCLNLQIKLVYVLRFMRSSMFCCHPVVLPQINRIVSTPTAYNVSITTKFEQVPYLSKIKII